MKILKVPIEGVKDVAQHGDLSGNTMQRSKKLSESRSLSAAAPAFIPNTTNTSADITSFNVSAITR